MAVQLTGYQGPRGFKPEQVYDPSKQMLQASARDVEIREASLQRYRENVYQVGKQIDENQKNNLEALRTFSESLGTFLVEKQKENNKQQYRLGVADILTGRVKLPEATKEEFNKQRAYLEMANNADQEAIGTLRQTNPAAAETMLQDSQAVRGWRAYGQAVGLARKVRGIAPGFFDEFMDSDEQIPITINGQPTFITPKTAKTQEEVAAAYDVGLQKLMEKYNIQNLNPVIIEEELSSPFSDLEANVKTSKMREISKVRESNARLELADRFAAAAPGLTSGVTKDAAKFQGELDYTYNRLLELNNGDRAKSNTDLQELVLNQTTIIAQSNPYQAQELLNTFRASYLNPNNTNLGTWGDRTDVSSVSDLILRKQEQYESAKDKTDKETVANLLNLYKSSGQNYEQIFQELNLLDKSNPGIATAALAEMQEMGPGYLSPYDSERLAKSAKNKAQLDYWKRYGSITDDQYNREATRFADQPNYVELLKASGIKTAVLAAYEKRAGAVTFEQQQSFTRQADASANFAANIISRRILGQLQRGELSVPEIQEQAVAQAEKFAEILVTRDKDPLKAQYSTEYKQLPADIRKDFESVTPIGDGTNGVDLTRTPPHKSPFVTSAVNSDLISPQQIQRNIDAITNGGQATADVKMYAKTSGVGIYEFLKKQAARHSIPFNLNNMGDAAKTYQENRKINPRAAEALTNPRITGEQRRMYIQQLERSRARQQIPTLPAKPLSSYKAQVSSVNFEDYVPGKSGQPGVDLYFEDKQFPVVMPGLVKDISYEPGYGHYVVVESTDPETGEQVDVLYGHLATRTHLRKGQQVSEGQLVGIQGGTGNVRSADGTIASIDFLAPAPEGSGSMIPYRNFDRLRRRIVSMFGK